MRNRLKPLLKRGIITFIEKKSEKSENMRTILIILGILLFVNLVVITISKVFADEENISLQQAAVLTQIQQ